MKLKSLKIKLFKKMRHRGFIVIYNEFGALCSQSVSKSLKKNASENMLQFGTPKNSQKHQKRLPNASQNE
mgnify:CR=1 FL=1